jgi:hypothetical protein
MGDTALCRGASICDTGGKMTLRETIARALALLDTRNADLETRLNWKAFGRTPASVAHEIWREYEDCAEAALEAIRAAGPTEAQIEAAAKVLADESTNIEDWEILKPVARACLSAAKET